MASQRALLPRSTPAASGMSSRAITALLDRLEAQSIECHSIMVVRHGHVVAEGWWAPYSAERPHLLRACTAIIRERRRPSDVAVASVHGEFED